VVQDFEGKPGTNWTATTEAAVGLRAGVCHRVFTAWGGFSLPLDGIPTDVDGIVFWIRTGDGRTAALSFGLFEWEGRKQLEAFGARIWATPHWQRYTFPLDRLSRVWAAAGNKKLDREKVRTLQFQRLIWSGRGLASDAVAFDHVEFVTGTKEPAVERRTPAVTLRVDAGRVVARLPRFWRAISPADTVEQNTFFEGPDGDAMRILAADRTFDYARITWHVNPTSSRWITYRYGRPIYTEDAEGNASYEFADQDTLVDNIIRCGLTPMMLLHGLPHPLASEPNPRPEGGNDCPPADYAKWQALVRAFAQHYVDKYGADEVATWYWEIWNEPDLWWQTWKLKGKDAGPEPHARLYDHAAAAITAACPDARIGGPAIAGYPRYYAKLLLQHAVQGTNAVTGGQGAPLAFLSHHGYSSPFDQMVKLYEQKDILDRLAPDRPIEVHVTEYGNAIWGYRQATRHQAASLCQAIDAYAYAARADNARVTWLFWFGVLRAFSGNCDAYFAPPDPKRRYQATTLFLHVKETLLAKPVCNAYRALKHLDQEWLPVSGAAFGDQVHALATRAADGKRVSILIYNHDPLDLQHTGRPVPVALSVANLPFGDRMAVDEFRIDSRHSDVFAAWEAEGSPAHGAITAEQVRRIKKHDRLEQVGPTRAVPCPNGAWTTETSLEPHAVVLLVLTPRS
jgi:xylan 1,4-beta-xylosidase